LVNVVGGSTAPSAGFAALPDREWHKALDLNLLSAVRLDRGLLPSMLRQRSDHSHHFNPTKASAF
jgi:NAD(P)-dependent dehydrogenase (short-subunit alcohol dehydrogenase family)